MPPQSNNSKPISNYSADIFGVSAASSVLITENAEHLLKHIYQHTDRAPYDRAELRVGMAIKILVKAHGAYSQATLQPIIEDLEALISDANYLKQFPNPEARKEALSKELSLLNKLLEMDDTMTLNSHAPSLF